MCSAGIRSPVAAMCRGFSFSGRAHSLHMSAPAYEYATGAATHTTMSKYTEYIHQMQSAYVGYWLNVIALQQQMWRDVWGAAISR